MMSEFIRDFNDIERETYVSVQMSCCHGNYGGRGRGCGSGHNINIGNMNIGFEDESDNGLLRPPSLVDISHLNFSNVGSSLDVHIGRGTGNHIIIDEDDDIVITKNQFNKVVAPVMPVVAGYIPFWNVVQINLRRRHGIAKGIFCNFMKRMNYKRKKEGKDCYREVGGLLISGSL
jgi:hypothetical protein